MPQLFTGLISTFGGQTFMNAAGIGQSLLLQGQNLNIAQQIASATASFGPLAGTVQTVNGDATNVGGQLAILVP
jgi:hypothetical protein